ncbi:MAG: DUF1926 domain-containing protein [Betaproteobacteria bacterium]|nr:DUF1926 domain-containing protein [Betaproteobacteria bacterium]
MTSTVSLLFGVHAHQPAGNFPSVVDEAHEKSYGPFLRVVHRYPEFRFAAHFSGWLLEYLLERFPEDMALLREMVERGQVELFGGGDMEPVLASIPYRDRVGQVNALSKRLEEAFGQRPGGAWLTERVWEATVVPALADADIEYVTVDDYHFVCAGRDLAELTGYFSTEEDTRRLDLFPISEQLRYRIPFAPAVETVRYLESLAVEGREVAGIYFDDIEKFGIWPETYDWVYGKRWLEDFIEAVLASNTVHPCHFGEFRAQQATRGVVYLPTTSYIEMGEWTLPAHRADDLAELVAQQKGQGQYERFKPFLRGGIWRNFLSRYPEANWMHKRMLSLSDRVAALEPAARTPGIVDRLYRAQANDGYWHGLFGGIYLPHLRRAIWNAIVGLERDLDRLSPRSDVVVQDLDFDGCDEVFLHTAHLQAVVRNDADAALCELSSYDLSHNFADTLTRRREHYYRNLARRDEHASQHGGIASAHDRVAFRHEIRPEDTVSDDRLRSCFLDSVVDEGEELHPCYARVPGTDAEFAAGLSHGHVTKTYALDGNRLRAAYVIELTHASEFRVQLNLAMPSCDGFLGRISRNGVVAGGFGEPMDHGSPAELLLEDGVLGGHVSVRAQPAARMTSAPLHTVSQSEAGFEKIMQALTTNLAWSLPVGRTRIDVELRFGTAAQT